MSYDEYKDAIARAKWSLTFGEGLDGYFLEAIFSGGIGFAVYNPEFFTEEFKSLITVYDGYENVVAKICEDIDRLDRADLFAEYQAAQYELCAKYYKYSDYLDNVACFYHKYFQTDQT